MRLLIDGYNLMHAAGFTHALQDERGLQRSREALLRFLAEVLQPAEAAETVIVFDAADAPAGLPAEIDHHGMQIHFARNHAEADDLIEELIRGDHSPKQLTVVSSDHRLHKAARRRRATAVDSEVWYEAIERRGRVQGFKPPRQPTKPTGPLSPDEVEHWTALFSDEKLADIIQEETKRPVAKQPGRPAAGRQPRAKKSPPEQPPRGKPARKANRRKHSGPDKPAGGNPFPDGYADDVDFEVEQ